MTRWNSEFIMLRSILKIAEDKLNEIGCKTKLSIYEQKLLGEVCAILEPIKKPPLLVHGEKHVTSSFPVPVDIRHQNINLKKTCH